MVEDGVPEGRQTYGVPNTYHFNPRVKSGQATLLRVS